MRRAKESHEVPLEPLDISALPPELIRHIFTFLTLKERIRAERVCKRWQKINRNAFANFQVKLVVTNEDCRKNSIFGCLKRHGNEITDLELYVEKGTDLPQSLVRKVLDHCANLEKITLCNFPKVTARTMNHLDAKCAKLTDFYFLASRREPMISEGFRLDAKKSFVGEPTSFLFVLLENFRYSSGVRAPKWLRRCEGMLDLQVTCEPLSWQTGRLIKQILQRAGKTLKYLSLYNDLFQEDKSFDYGFVKNELSTCDNLICLSLSDYVACDETVQLVARVCKGLRQLSLISRLVTAKCFESVAKMQLEYFSIALAAEGVVTDESVTLLRGNPHLEEVRIRWHSIEKGYGIAALLRERRVQKVTVFPAVPRVVTDVAEEFGYKAKVTDGKCQFCNDKADLSSSSDEE